MSELNIDKLTQDARVNVVARRVNKTANEVREAIKKSGVDYVSGIYLAELLTETTFHDGLVEFKEEFERLAGISHD